VYALGSIPQVGRWPWVQANLRLAPGNSGGPLADSQGRVVGINTMVFGGLGLAIPSKAVKAFLSNGVSTVTLGVVLRPVVWDRPKRRFGLMILEVQSGTPAERASLLPGDIITGVDGKSVKRIDDLAAALDGTGNRLLRLQFLRAASTVQREVAVDLGPSREKAA
jgi:serine protease Do